MNMTRIALIGAIALCAYLLLLRWDQQFSDQPGDQAGDPFSGDRPLAEQSQAATPALPADAGADTDPAAADTGPVSSGPPASGPVASGLDSAPVSEALSVAEPTDATPAETLLWRTDTLQLTLSVNGGDIERLELLHHARQQGQSEPVKLMDGAGPARYFARTGLQYSDGGLVPLQFAQLSGAGENPDELRLRHSGADGLIVERSYRLEPGSYLIEIEDRLTNETDTTLSLEPYAAFYRNDQRLTPSLLFGINSYLGGAWSRPDDRYIKVDFEDMREDPVKEHAFAGWLAMIQHYFVAAWVPDTADRHLYQMRFLPERNLYVMGLTSPALRLLPGQSGSRRILLYAGPKDQDALRKISPGLELTVDYGWLWWIGQPLYAILSLLHDLVGNWGWAIVLLTVLIKLAIYPLSAAGFRSMGRMRLLQPEMERLRERYGEDKRKMAEKSMELYRERGVNPLGGCLPLLIPMPVFLALYWVLLESVELRHAPWLLWITDLSARDPYFVLPLLMGASMIATQMMSPPPATMEPIQRRMLQLMPVFFTVFFLWFPSGLVLYWLSNNLLSLLQQWWITRSLRKA